MVRGKIRIRVHTNNKYSIVFFLLWLTYAMITLAWVKDYLSWIRAIYFIALGVLCIVTYINIFNTTKDVLAAFRLMSAMAAVHNAIGWYEITTGNYPFLDTERILKYSEWGYPISTFRNTNDFATFMLFSVFIAYVCAANAQGKSKKLFYIAVMASSSYMVFQASSRANILGLIVASIVFVGLSMRNRNWRLGFMTALAIMSVFLLINLTDVLKLVDEYLDLVFYSNRGSEHVRMNLIKDGLTFLKSTFGFGTGAGNIEYWMENHGVHNKSSVLRMHNWWMEILVSYGVIIFILYVIFYLKLFIDMYQIYCTSEDKENRSVSLGIFCCAAGFVIGSISASSNISVEWLWCFWAICIVYQGNCRNLKHYNKHKETIVKKVPKV